MKNKVIIFDMDGVLFDTIPYAKKNFLTRHPGVTDEMYYKIHTGNYHEEVKKYSHLKIKETEEEREKSRIEYTKNKSKASIFAGMKNFLKDLNNLGFILVLNTNAYNRNCLPLLKGSGVKKLFDFIASAEVSKSKIEKFRLIEEKYNVEKEDLLFITDALGDVKDANLAKIPTIAVTWGVHNKSFFKHEDYSNLINIVDTVEELKDFVKNY